MTQVIWTGGFMNWIIELQVEFPQEYSQDMYLDDIRNISGSLTVTYSKPVPGGRLDRTRYLRDLQNIHLMGLLIDICNEIESHA